MQIKSRDFILIAKFPILLFFIRSPGPVSSSIGESPQHVAGILRLLGKMFVFYSLANPPQATGYSLALQFDKFD
jgi:hypothetical protein